MAVDNLSHQFYDSKTSTDLSEVITQVLYG